MDTIRFLLVAGVWLLPGFAAARLLRLDRPRVGGATADPMLLAAAAFAMAAALGSVPAAVLAAAGGSPALLAASMCALAVLGGIALARPWARGAPPAPGLPAAFAAWLALAAAGLRAGASLRFTGDAPDHVGTLREILASSRFFPTEAFHLGVGALGFDPRKGLLHPVYAALAQLGGLDPLELWIRLPALAAPIPAFAAYAAMRWLGFDRRAGWIAFALTLVTWSGGLGADYLGIAPFPNQLGAALFWMAAALAVRFVVDGGRRAGLAAVLASFGAVAVHPMYAVFVALGWCLIGLGALLRPSAAGALPRGLVVRRLGAAAAGLVLLIGPYLAYRLPQLAAANPIHTELQGMLLLGDRFFVADPGLLWRHVGFVGAVAYPLLLLASWRGHRRDAGRFLLFWGTVAALNLTFNPLLVPALQKTVSYLVFRSFWFVPPAIAAAAALAYLFEGAAPRRARAGTAALILGLAALPGALSAVRGDWIIRTAAERDGALSPLPWRDDLAAVLRDAPPRATVLSDPITSSVLPAFTRQRIVAGLDQHTSPNDAHGLERLLLAGRVLSPAVPPSDAHALCAAAEARFGARVDYVLLNEGFVAPVLSATWRADRAIAAARREQLEVSPWFTRVASRGSFTLFTPAAAGPDSGASDPGFTVPAEIPVEPGDTIPLPGGMVAIARFAAPVETVPGEEFRVRLLWTAAGPEPIPPGRYAASLRLDALDNPLQGKPFEKLLRKLDERLRGRRLRARVDWIPTGGAEPPWTWRAGAGVPDSVTVRVPNDLAPGTYSVSLALPRLAPMPNHRLKDYLNDDDLYSGAPVDTMVVTAPEAPEGRHR